MAVVEERQPRWWWRFVPARLQPPARAVTRRVYALRWRLGGLVRRFVALVRRMTLGNYRDAVAAHWPSASGLDVYATAVVLYALRFHQSLLGIAWGNAHLVRRHRSPRAVARSRLRVMHVTSSFDLGGTQRQIKNLCTSTATRFEHTTTEIFPEMNFLFRADVGVESERYVTGGMVARAVGRCAANINTRSAQLVQAYKLFRDFMVAEPDVVVGWGHEMAVTGFLAAAFARVPHVVFCIRTFNPTHGWVDAEIGRQLAIAHQRMTPYAAAVITNSTPLREDHARWVGIEASRIAVCPNGIEAVRLTDAETLARRVAVRKQLGIDDAAKIAINVGRFSAEKGQQTIIAINHRLQDRVHWLLCGDGPTFADVRSAADGMTNVHFVGRTTAVYDYLCASDIFVMPSDFEGMPNAMMEAMACGLPCVSTDRSGAVDVARHGQEALFYKVGDLATMEQHVRFLLDHPDEARAMGQRARARLHEFSPQRSVDLFEHILERAIPQRVIQEAP